jgi:hypothetical protein
MLMDAYDVSSLRQQAESLTQRAVDEGANVDFQRVREWMDIATEFEVPELLSRAIGYLESEIAAVNRKKRKGSSRKSFVLKIKNLQIIKKLL